MINTIFYFVETDAEYQLKRALGEISNKTIVFVEDTREIYINGRGYGKTSTAGLVNNSEFEQWKNTILGIITGLQSEAAQKDQEFADTLERELNAAKAELQQLITAADNRVSAVSSELNSFTSGLDSEIQGAVSDAISDALTDYRDEDAWTEINNTKAGLSTVTNKVNNITDSEGNIKYSVVQSAINTGIANNQAFTDISNRWATAAENQAVLEWLAGGFKSQVSEGTSFASVYAAEKSATGSAISQMKTEVLGDIESGYVSKTSLASSVTDIVKDGLSITSLADIALQSDITSATNTLLTTFNNSISQIQLKSTEQDARLDLLTTVTTPAGSQNSVVSINEANLDLAMARILATSGSAAASQINVIAEGNSSGVDIQSSINSAVATATAGMATTAYVDGAENRVSSYLKDGQGNIITSSSLQNAVTADHSTLTALSTTVNGLLTAQAGLVTLTGLGDAVASLIAQNGDVRSAITTYVNGDTSNITLNADLIYLDANKTLANTIEASLGNIGGYTISSNGLEATNTTTGNGIAITTDHIQTVKNNVPTNNFNADGSGFIATGGISWNNNGQLTLSQTFLNSLFNALGNGFNNSATYGGATTNITDSVVINEDKTNPEYLPVKIVSGSLGPIISDFRVRRGSCTFDDSTLKFNTVSVNNGRTITTTKTAEFDSTIDPSLLSGEYGTIILYDQTNPSATGQYPLSGTLAQKKEWLLNKACKKALVFDRGIMTGVQRATVNGVIESEITQSYIDGLVYLLQEPEYTASDKAQSVTSWFNSSANKSHNVTFGWGTDPNDYVYSDDYTDSEFYAQNTITFTAEHMKTFTGFTDGSNVAYGYSNVPNISSPQEGDWCFNGSDIWRYGTYNVKVDGTVYDASGNQSSNYYNYFTVTTWLLISGYSDSNLPQYKIVKYIPNE